MLIAYVLCTGIFIASYSVLAASWYDIRTISRRARLATITRRQQHAGRPSVAVLIDADTSSDMLPQCLQALNRNHYRHLTCLVTTRQPNVTIKHLIQGYQRRHSKLPLRYYAPRRIVSQTVRLRQAYRRLPKHDYILILRASDIISPALIQQATVHFSDDSQLGALQFTRHSQLSPTFLALLERYGEMSHQLVRKAAPHVTHHILTRLQTSTLYQHRYFTTQVHRQRFHYRYAASLTITTPQTLPTQLSRYSIPWWLLSTVAVAFLTLVAIIAATLQSNAPLLLTWISICLWTLIAIWSETASQPRQKITLSYGLLLAPLLLFVQCVWFSLALPITMFYRFAASRIPRASHHIYRQHFERYMLAVRAWYERMYLREMWYQDEWRTDD